MTERQCTVIQIWVCSSLSEMNKVGQLLQGQLTVYVANDS